MEGNTLVVVVASVVCMLSTIVACVAMFRIIEEPRFSLLRTERARRRAAWTNIIGFAIPALGATYVGFTFYPMPETTLRKLFKFGTVLILIATGWFLSRDAIRILRRI